MSLRRIVFSSPPVAPALDTVNASYGPYTGLELVAGNSTKGGPTCIGPLYLLLLLAFGVRLFAVLASILRMLLGTSRVFFALCMVAFAMMFCRGSMGFGSILMMFRCLNVLVSRH
jgi:hypothetical protein